VDLPGVGGNLIDHAMLRIRLTTRSAPLDNAPLAQVIGWCTAPDSTEVTTCKRP
jgi:hypothetical protein